MEREKLKKIVRFGIPLVVVLGYLCFVFITIIQEEKYTKAEGVEVAMTNPQFHFVTEKEIKQLIVKQVGAVKETPIDSVDSHRIEQAIQKKPFVEEVQVFRTNAAAYRVEITQRTPVLRIMSKAKSYYLDKEGFAMPVGKKYPALVHIYKGDISLPFAKTKLLDFQKYLDKHPFWAELIDYVEVVSNKELILFLKVQSGKIYFGKVDNIAEQLSKFKLFINKVGKHNGLELYQAIDLRFNNQVVVKKK